MEEGLGRASKFESATSVLLSKLASMRSMIKIKSLLFSLLQFLSLRRDVCMYITVGESLVVSAWKKFVKVGCVRGSMISTSPIEVFLCLLMFRAAN